VRGKAIENKKPISGNPGRACLELGPMHGRDAGTTQVLKSFTPSWFRVKKIEEILDMKTKGERRVRDAM
jgi:hypothetical protein